MNCCVTIKWKAVTECSTDAWLNRDFQIFNNTANCWNKNSKGKSRHSVSQEVQKYEKKLQFSSFSKLSLPACKPPNPLHNIWRRNYAKHSNAALHK